MRVIPTAIPEFDSLHLPGHLGDVANLRNGIVLVTGPTSSGKSSTVAALLDRINRERDYHIITIEDPIEMVHDEFNQVAVRANIDLTFANALRTVLRQDPDIIMVGEIRDPETAQYAVQAALTGHLVLSTLHTNDAPSSVTRLLDLGVPHFLILSTVIGIIAQRLVRMNCPRCRKPIDATIEMSAGLGMAIDDLRKHQLMKGEGCLHCRQTGYIGRDGIFQIMPITEKIRGLIGRQASSIELFDGARTEGMRTLREAAIEKVLQGETTVSEMMRVAGI
jgi:general secretion pathway protein E